MTTVFRLFLVLLFCATAVFAQTAGKIEGMARDKDTGSPLRGVQVQIDGTRLGNVTNDDGYYFILNVPVGLRTVKFTYTGYKPVTVVDVRVLAGNTITVNTEMNAAVIGMEAITVEGQAEPLMMRDNVQTRQNMNASTIAQTPADNLQDLLVLQAGVVVDPSGNYSLRGGREGRGADVCRRGSGKSSERAAGAEDRGAVDTNAGGLINPLFVANDAIEEVSVITGGFQAEYGNAQSGMINIVTKEGGSRMAGSLQLSTDEVMPLLDGLRFQ